MNNRMPGIPPMPTQPQLDEYSWNTLFQYHGWDWSMRRLALIFGGISVLFINGVAGMENLGRGVRWLSLLYSLPGLIVMGAVFCGAWISIHHFYFRRHFDKDLKDYVVFALAEVASFGVFWVCWLAMPMFLR